MHTNGTKPRHRWNRLPFLAAEHATLSRLNDVARIALAWGSIVDIKAERLTVDNLQRKQAEKELQTAEEVLPRAARESYRWLLCPMQERPADKPEIETFPLNTAASPISREIERVCVDNELVITTWSPIHLRTKLQDLYWKESQTAAGAMAFWEDTLRYLYLPRLKDRDMLAQAVRSGAASKDFFGTAYGQHDGKFDGFQFGSGNVQLDDTLLLIDPKVAAQYEASHTSQALKSTETGAVDRQLQPTSTASGTDSVVSEKAGATVTGALRPRTFHGTVEVAPATSKMRLVQIADEIVSVLGVQDFGKEEGEQLQRGLARQTGADRAATDCARVLRIAGLLQPQVWPAVSRSSRGYRQERLWARPVSTVCHRAGTGLQANREAVLTERALTTESRHHAIRTRLGVCQARVGAR